MKKIINKILFSFICMFMVMNFAYGDGTTIVGNANRTDYINSNGKQSDKFEFNFPGGNGLGNDSLVGKRFSVVTSTGEVLNTIDYILAGTCGNCYFAHSTPKSRIDYLNGESLNQNRLYNTNSHKYISLSNNEELKEWTVSEMFDIEPKTLSNAKDIFSKYLPEGYDIEPNDNGVYDYFLIWEPLVVVGYDSKRYVGTPYEISNMLARIRIDLRDENGQQIFNHSQWYGRVAIPETIYNAASLVYLDQNNQIFGESVTEAGITGFQKNYFSNLSGGLKLIKKPSEYSCAGTDYVCESKTCDSKCDQRDQILDVNNGLGIGILWFNQIAPIEEPVKCEDVERYYIEQQNLNLQTYFRFNDSFNFSEFNNYWKAQGNRFKEIDDEWYKKNCLSGRDEGDNCTPKYNVPSCTEGDNKTLVYSDSGEYDTSERYWQNCVFEDFKGYYTIMPHKTSGGSSLTYRDRSLGSKYCEVYCIESVTANFDSNNPTVLAGSKFTWGWGTINSTRTCRTKSINFDQFLNDYNSTSDSYLKNQAISNIEKCYGWEDSSVLNDQSKANISYDGGTYHYSSEMDKETNVSSNENSDCTNYSIGGKVIKKCSSYEKTVTSNASFSLKDGVYRYIVKGYNGLTITSIHEEELNRYKTGSLTVNYVDAGYSNFPVPYNMNEEKYEGTLNITYSNLGHKSSTDINETDVDRILNSTFTDKYSTYGKWSCGYEVDQEFIIDPTPDPDKRRGDINVIYREIDLYNPFPDIDASTRATGANWCDSDSCAWNNATSTSYILKNRNVTGDDIYNLEPMYTFIMTPSDIIKIRSYNKENTYTSYTGSYGGNTYDFKCIEGTNRGCRSEYLTELLNMMDANNQLGSCKNERDVYNTVGQFESCRY